MFIEKNFMLESDIAQELYHNHAEPMPIIDYHCHLDPEMIAKDHIFSSITELWLGGDHYKWRALRGNGVDEKYITGDASDFEKFDVWAHTMPYTMRNPLYHWTHLELSSIFGIDKVLNAESSREIYERCNSKLAYENFSARGLIKMSNVEILCTTDDPIDTLEHHKSIAESDFGVKVLPTWRPDKAMAVENVGDYNIYIDKLESASNTSIGSYAELQSALKNRHDFFASLGCSLSDHGMDTFYAEEYTQIEINSIFNKVRGGKGLTPEEVLKFKSAMMIDFAVMDHKKDWTQQFHIGPIRNNNTKMFNSMGADVGFDAINDLSCAAAGHKFLDKLASSDLLAKSILYNLNPKDNEVLAAMAATFNDGSVAGKIQFGSAWWFLDQEVGMTKQINTLSAFGLLSRFVGMLTDSRSFTSYPRHEYFRRVLCNIIGDDVTKGKLPKSELAFIGQMVEDICYNNAKRYFKF